MLRKNQVHKKGKPFIPNSRDVAKYKAWKELLMATVTFLAFLRQLPD
jgi:hypothetical protein